MSERASPQASAWIRHLPLLAGVCVLSVGAAVSIGWWQDIALLKSVSPRFVSMKAIAAAAFVLLGAALSLAALPQHAATRWARWGLQFAALLLGLVTVVQYATGVDFGVDQLLTPAPLNEFQTAAPGRMSLIAAVCFALCAAALFAERVESPRGRATARTLATCVGIVGLLALLGYLYGAPVLYRPAVETTAIAIHSAVGFMLLAAGIVALHPQYGLPSIATGQTLIGTHLRWLFPAAVLIPPLIGGVAVQTYQAFGVARVSIAITAAGTTIAIGLAVAIAALYLRRMEDRLEVSNRALAATKQGVFIADNTEPGRPIVYVNEAFTQLSGYSAREAIGRDCDFLVNDGADRAALESFRHALDAQANCTATLPSKRRDGTVFSGRFSISAVPGSDGANHLVGLLEDVTAEQLSAMARLELLAEASQARKDAETANRVKDVFFASVTHELRSPLNACLMWLDVLALGPLSDKSAKAIDAIRRNLRIQTRLVNDLIDAAKISSGGIEIHREPLDVSMLVSDNVDTWRLMATARQIDFGYRATLGEYVLNVDPERLLQVLNNLLENAFSNTPAGGRVELSLQADGDGVSIEVADTGCGLSTEDLQRVFAPFWRAATTSPEHKGLGLGLAIAEDLVKGHQGTLNATSDGSGKGCVFTVRLPYPAARVYGASAGEKTLRAR